MTFFKISCSVNTLCSQEGKKSFLENERALGFFRAKMSLAMHSMSRAAIWKELRETQEKLFESQLKVMKTKSATLSELYMGRIRMLEANVTAIQEGLDALDFEDKMDAISPKKRKKRKVVPAQVELPRGLIESGDEDSDVGDEDEDVDDEIAAASASIGY
ncbi:hypothetical protein SEMRO_1676_G290510.1 [Seminavis robusta]|uniref:Uncharacterized protein n=1 Tax=Seminavis robusta TaxID=568900 RepID=A0A9N8EP73_9STRA|nr:hypothetical protein SEMRO_1676_G290510.1 [Seminavis robusta]|eukprot:Sro1676_g290510.1 n/a (160) ;mRNA; f:18047-18526